MANRDSWRTRRDPHRSRQKALREKLCRLPRTARSTGSVSSDGANKFGKQFVKTHMIKLAEIGTDPALALNFATRQVDGSLQPAGAAKVPRPVILGLAVGGVIAKKVAEHRPPLDSGTLIVHQRLS